MNTTPPTPIALEVLDIRKAFGDTPVLRGVSLKFEEGRTAVILGPSGSGKSTLLRCMNLLEPADSGQIIVGGQDIGTHKSRDAWMTRRDIGMVFQNFELFQHLTVLDNIMLAPMNVKGISRRDAEAEARRLLEKVRIPEKADAYPRELSGGQQQRVAIARALAMKPRLMLYDEPTSALDPEMIKEVLDVIQQLSSEGMTSIIVTHEMGFARRIADQLVFMDEGQVVYAGIASGFFENAEHPRARQFLNQVLAH
ncbi:MAG: amino acid ABC transporter ATP-binding protein [Hyphomicrobiales bacterium]|nr:MAG: amino acid ABC transporter ATP-binding protein [Hyphomicrobiales bacterium]